MTELETGIDHGTYDTEAEPAACLVFLGLRLDQVEVLSNMPLMASSLTGAVDVLQPGAGERPYRPNRTRR